MTTRQMEILLVIFQSDTEKSKKDIVDNIKKLGPWAKVTETAYCVKTNGMTAIQARDRLMALIRDGSLLLVVEMTKSLWGSYRLPEAVTDWLRSG